MESSDTIQVIVRVRPLNSQERCLNQKSCLRYSPSDPGILILDSKPDPKFFSFDLVASEDMSQSELFQHLGRPITSSALEGYNVCLFAYGQTGAGKTFTMQGSLDDPKDRGLQPRIFEQIFALIGKARRESSGSEFLVKCSYIEVYNEQIMDLVLPNNPSNEFWLSHSWAHRAAASKSERTSRKAPTSRA